MRIIHAADLHLGQILYNNYERTDEHRHFFRQLEEWSLRYSPDALIISGDIFDIQYPSATVSREFSDLIVSLHRHVPNMRIVITAGNHDSASRIASNMPIWRLAGMTLVGLPPAMTRPIPDHVEEPDTTTQSSPSSLRNETLYDDYIVELPTGYIIALPFMTGDRRATIRQLQDEVDRRNTSALPVVMTGHADVTGSDPTGQDTERGNIRSIPLETFGTGYDYLALGHIHRTQLIGQKINIPFEDESPLRLPAPVAAYSGSILHVSHDEAYPHSVLLVDIDHHQGEIELQRLRINQLRHFYTLPSGDEPDFKSVKEILKSIEKLCKKNPTGYFRLKIREDLPLPSDFHRQVYGLIEKIGNDIRYNPKIEWIRSAEAQEDRQKEKESRFAVADLQQMTDPLQFIEATIDRYPELKGDIESLREAFREIEEFLKD